MSGLMGGSSGSKELRVKEFRSSGTFTVPAGVKTVELFLVGGGGATAAGSQVGGQGGNVVKTKYDVNGKMSCAVVIGAGGSTDGANGGDSSFDGVVVAMGGRGSVFAAPSGTTPIAFSASGVDGFGGHGAAGNSTIAGNGARGSSGTPAANSGAGASGQNTYGGSGYCRVEWYE